ncbi:hypothetical protein K0651_04630 [Ornithinimicrobium sp. Arc0846-15]|nr:hypothetical protein [Ornithinimicrobium laminariae]
MGRHRQVNHEGALAAERETVALEDRLRAECINAASRGDSVAAVLRRFVKEHDGVDVAELEDRDYLAWDAATARHRHGRHSA